MSPTPAADHVSKVNWSLGYSSGSWYLVASDAAVTPFPPSVG